MLIIKTINELLTKLNDEEKDFLFFIISELETFNNVYLMSKRYLDRIDEITDKYFNMEKVSTLTKFHYYISIGIKFDIVMIENKCNYRFLDSYKETIKNLSELGIDSKFVTDKDVEKTITDNKFYYLIFIIKIINIFKGEENE